MNKNFKIILGILVAIVILCIGYFIGYKKAYNQYEAFLNNNDNGVEYQSFMQLLLI